MKKKGFWYGLAIILIIMVYAYHVRSAYITQFTWKQTSEKGLVGGGIICFREGSTYTYQWPTIREGDDRLGIVVLCIGKRMVVYSLQDRHFGYYMYI